MFFAGEGVPSDVGKAKEWWQKAAAQGYENAQKKLEQLKELEKPNKGKAPIKGV